MLLTVFVYIIQYLLLVLSLYLSSRKMDLAINRKIDLAINRIL